MTKQLDERKIIEALNKVATIDGNSDIVTAGAVSGVVIKEGHIGFTIEIDPKDNMRVTAKVTRGRPIMVISTATIVQRYR